MDNADTFSNFYLGILFCPQMQHVEERFGKETNKEVLLMCIGITSGVGRLIFGRVADYVNGVNKVYLQVSGPSQQHPLHQWITFFV